MWHGGDVTGDTSGREHFVNIDTWKLKTGDYIDTDAIGSLKTGLDEIPGTYTDNIRPVANLEIGSATDIMFQRRTVEQTLRGETIDAVKDYAFVGKSASRSGSRSSTSPTRPSRSCCGRSRAVASTTT